MKDILKYFHNSFTAFRLDFFILGHERRIIFFHFTTWAKIFVALPTNSSFPTVQLLSLPLSHFLPHSRPNFLTFSLTLSPFLSSALRWSVFSRTKTKKWEIFKNMKKNSSFQKLQKFQFPRRLNPRSQVSRTVVDYDLSL